MCCLPATKTSRSQVGCSVDYTDQPSIPTASSNAELKGEGQVCTIGTSLIPSLYCSSDRAECNGEVQSHRVTPSVCMFPLDDVLLLSGELWNVAIAVLCLKERQDRWR